MAEKDYPKFHPNVVDFAEEKSKRHKLINRNRAAWRRFKRKNFNAKQILHAKES